MKVKNLKNQASSIFILVFYKRLWITVHLLCWGPLWDQVEKKLSQEGPDKKDSVRKERAI